MKATNRKATGPLPCPCGRGYYADCCEPLHAGTPAASAQALMRSRYSAYVLNLASYLQASWHESTRPAELDLDNEQTNWLGLDVRGHSQQGDTATVEFVARYKLGGRAHRIHEISRFVCEDGRWYYIDGELPQG